MIRDARVLRGGFVPREIEHRDAEVNHLSSVLEPITNGEPADTALVTGPSGVGKTCISKFVTERLREEALDVDVTYVNCWRNYTRFRTLYQILDDIGATIDIHRQSTPHDELINRLQQYDGPRTVVILDEADQLEDPSVIYALNSLPQFAIICIANTEEELFSRVDDRLVSRLRSSEHVRMDKYHDEQLYDILSARAHWGLDEAAVTDDQLYRIADAAAGDARLAIGILRTAASTADRENHERITDAVDIRLEHEAHYDWVAFVPQRDSAAGALTKYFGKVSGADEFKIRGIEARQRSTPLFVEAVQRACLERLDATRSPEAVIGRLKRVISRLHADNVAADRLVECNRVSKPLTGYTHATRNVVALERARDQDLAVHPGQDIEYVVIDDANSSRDRVALAHKDVDTYDASYYETQLVRAVESVLSPLGWDRDDIRATLAATSETALGAFGSQIV